MSFRPFATIGLFSILLLSVIPPAAAEGVRGRIRLSWDEVESDDTRLQIMQQDYRVWMQQPVTPYFSYLARVQYRDSETRDDAGAALVDSGQTLFEPTLELSLETPLWDLSTGFRYTEDKQEFGGMQSRDTRGDWYSRFNWRPVDLPVFSLLYQRLRLRADDDSVDTDEGRFYTDAAYDAGPLRFGYNLNRRVAEDNRIDFERETRAQVASVDYRDRFASNKLSVSAGYLIQEDKVVERAGAPVDVVTELDATAGLFAIDAMPLLDPLAPEPGLVDGDTLSATAVALGGAASGGGEDRNVGLDFDLPTTVDGFELWMTTTIPPLSLDFFSWDLYSSEDNLNWTLEATDVAFVFNDIFDRFELGFTPVTARFLKIVNTDFDPALGPAFVTELRARVTTSVTGVQTRRNSLRNANLVLTYSPTQRWSLTSSTFASKQRNRGVQGTIRDDRADQSLSARYIPRQRLSASALVRWRVRNRNLAFNEDDFAWTVGVNATPLETVDMALSFDRAEDRRDSRPESEGSAWQFRTAAELLEELDASVDLTYSSRVDFFDERRTRQVAGRLSVFTRPRPELTYVMDLLINEARASGPAVVGDGRSDQRIWTHRLTFRPNPTFSLTAEVRDEELPMADGVAQSYNLDWLPFAGGAVQLTFSYATDLPGAFGGQRDLIRGLMRWTVRPGTIFDLSYFRNVVEDGGVERKVETLSTIIEIRF